jgi:hypothetical protein
MGVEAFGFNEALADQAEAGVFLMFGSMFLGGLCDPGGSGENKNFSVGKYAVYVEQEELDFAGATLGGVFPGHGRGL